jgi:hypothetical protein
MASERTIDHCHDLNPVAGRVGPPVEGLDSFVSDLLPQALRNLVEAEEGIGALGQLYVSQRGPMIGDVFVPLAAFPQTIRRFENDSVASHVQTGGHDWSWQRWASIIRAWQLPVVFECRPGRDVPNGPRAEQDAGPRIIATDESPGNPFDEGALNHEVPSEQTPGLQ